MSGKIGRRGRLLLVTLGLVLIVGGVHERWVAQVRPVPYGAVVDAYFQKPVPREQNTYEVDAWALWCALGIAPESLREPGYFNLRSFWWALRCDRSNLLCRGRPLFNAGPGGPTGLECDFVSLSGTKIIALTRDSFCTQVLVFRPLERRTDTTSRFSYHFLTANGRVSDRSGARLLEPEPGLELLAISYRNAYGTGTLGWGWSLYRLDASSATCLVQTRTDGWSIHAGPQGYGYRCEITDLARTWPRLTMAFYGEYSTGEPVACDPQGEDLVDVYELNAEVELVWDSRRRTFRPSGRNTLAEQEVRAIVEDPTEFLRLRAEGLVPFRTGGPVTRKRMIQSESLAGWGL